MVTKAEGLREGFFPIIILLDYLGDTHERKQKQPTGNFLSHGTTHFSATCLKNNWQPLT